MVLIFLPAVSYLHNQHHQKQTGVVPERINTDVKSEVATVMTLTPRVTNITIASTLLNFFFCSLVNIKIVYSLLQMHFVAWIEEVQFSQFNHTMRPIVFANKYSILKNTTELIIEHWHVLHEIAGIILSRISSCWQQGTATNPATIHTFHR